MTDIKTLASEAEKVMEGVMRLEPIIMTVSSFVPGAAPVMAIVHPAVVAMAPFIEKALTDIAAGNNTDAFTAFITMLQHISKGQPNAGMMDVSQMAPTQPTAPASVTNG